MTEAAPTPSFPERPDPIEYWATRAPDRVALVDRRAGDRLTYRNLDALAARWTGVLGDLEVGPGDRVGVLARNRTETIGLFLACGRIGAALVPYNWRLAAPELGVLLEDSRPAVVFFETALRALGESATQEAALGPTGSSRSSPRASPRWIDLDHEAATLLDRASAPSAPCVRDPETAALVLYTSGSTGRPKGAILPRRQLFYNAVATTTAWELGSSDIAPITTPLFHTGGWNVFATPLWHRGGTVVLMSDFEPETFLRELGEERCTVALTVPTQLLMMQDTVAWGRDLPDLRFFISGGAPCPPAVAERVRQPGYRFKEGYGLTECGPNCFGISLDEAEKNPGSVGRPVPFLRTRRVDADGRDVGPDEPGELLLRGPQVFAGYVGAPELSRSAFQDGWLRTGDIARADATGLHTICGRRKEMFISGGENVFPAEVEAVLSSAPGVAEAVVVGVPDARWGEVGRAFVVLDPGSAGVTAVEAFARDRLAGYKVPKAFVPMEAIPRLGSGKPDRARLLEMTPAR